MSHKIDTELDDEESTNLSQILYEYIYSHNDGAAVKFVLGEISKENLEWCQEHARHVEGIAKKLFPEWRLTV